MRNFEADKLVRIGDVMDILEKYARGGRDSHEIDLGEAGSHTVDCDQTPNLDDVVVELLTIAERGGRQ